MRGEGRKHIIIMIIYTVLARSQDGAVLVESTASGLEGNHPQITRTLVSCLQQNLELVPLGNRKTFVHRNTGDDSECDPENDFEGFWHGLEGFWGGVCDPGSKNQNSDDLGNYFHVLHGEGVFYICLSDDEIGRQQNV